MYEQLSRNKRNSALLIVAFVVMVLLVGAGFNYLFSGGWIGLVLAVVFTLFSTLIAYWKSDSVALSMSHAQPADPQYFAQLHNIVEGLAIAGGLPKPRVYVVDDPAPNAFATGRNPEHAAIAVTTGLLQKMNRDELEGVLSHELAHIKNYDILVSTLAVTMVGVIALLADWGLRGLWWGGGRSKDSNNNGVIMLVIAVGAVVLLILSPLIAKLMQASVSRRREALADFSGVMLTRNPQGLISALEKLRDDRTVVHTASRATAHLWIESPLARNKEEGSLSRLNNRFDTHPPLEERIEGLRKLSQNPPPESSEQGF